MRKQQLIVIVGPTAVGKTALCIQLAQKLRTPILSADSRQVYQQMRIGTAQPTPEERATVPHHLIDFVPIQQAYHVAHFERDALTALSRLWPHSNHLIMTGGSGLYIDAVCRGIIPLPPIHPSVKEELQATYEKVGLAPLLAQLATQDAPYYAQVDRKNPRRVLHALAVWRSTGKPYSHFRHQTIPKRPFHIIKIGLQRDKATLHQRIQQRIDTMIQAGLFQEAQQLYPYRRYRALQTIGYQELFPYFEGQATRAEAIQRLLINTRRYAKRQMTWFRRDPHIRWFSPDHPSPLIDYLYRTIHT